MTAEPLAGGLSAVRGDAVHGSYCPKMCNFACPVATATGREAFTPWGLHVTVAELATGRRDPQPGSYAALVGCTGCHACRDACLYGQDVPAQVRAARAAHDPGSHPAADRVRTDLVAGRSPYGTARPTPRDPDGTADLQLVAGCRDEPEVLAAATALFAAAGRTVRTIVPEGCCGAVATDLGLTDLAGDLRERLADRLDPQVPTVSTDPHCLPVLRSLVAAPVRDSVAELDRLLSGGALRLAGVPAGEASAEVAYHDPCLAARDEGTVDPPRDLLRAAGYDVHEPRRAGRRTVCSGGGMAMDLLDPAVAGTVAERRAEELGDRRIVVTACARAGAMLRSAGRDVRDLHRVLADRIPPEEAP